MSDRIVLMRQGRIAQTGTPRDLYDRPASRYVADFIGETNLLEGMVVAGGRGELALKVGDDVVRGHSDAPLVAGNSAWLAVRPEAIAVVAAAGPAAPGGNSAAAPGANSVAATVREAVYAGSAVRVHATLAGGQAIVAHVESGTDIRIGGTVRLAWPADRGRFVPE